MSALETTNIDVMHEVLDRVYGGRTRLRVNSGRNLMRLAVDPVGPLRLVRNTFSMRFDAVAEPLGTLTFLRIRRGFIDFDDGPHARSYSSGDILLVAQPDEPYGLLSDNLDVEAITMDPALPARVAGEPVRLTGYQPISARTAALWDATYTYVRDNVAGRTAIAQPLLAANAARLMTGVTLAAFPTGTDEATLKDRRDAHPASLRRAIAFAESNVDRDIGTADMAAAALVSVRAIQLAFRRHLDTTPAAYLRRIRLDRVHRELLAAEPASTTVSAVAARWGFINHSRFSAHYRATYGRPPSHTLRRR